VSALCPDAAVHLERAKYHVPAHMLRNWEPVTFRDDERQRTLSGWLSYIEGLLECAKRNAPHEVEHLEHAYDAIERELDSLDRATRRTA
jgi:hypothetical protein